MKRFELVPFDDRAIMAVREDDGVYVVMKPVAESLGLAWHGQFQRIKRHPVLGKGVRVLGIPSAGGEQDAVTLPLEQFHGWLVTISPNHIADEEKRALIIRYQERAFRVLFEHFHGKIGFDSGRAAQAEIADRTARRREIPRLMDMLERERNPAKRRVIHAMLVQNCEANRLAPPGIEEIGRDAPPLPDVLAPFWAGIAVLRAKGTLIDHSRVAGRLALNLKEVAAAFVAAGVPVRVDGPMKKALRQSEHPRFAAVASVNSAERGKTVSCFVFEEASLH